MQNELFTEPDQHLAYLLTRWGQNAIDNVPLLVRGALDPISEGQLVENLIDLWKRSTRPRLARAHDVRLLDEPMRLTRHAFQGSEQEDYWRWGAQFGVTGNMTLLTRWPKYFKGPPGAHDHYLLPAPDIVWQGVSEGVMAWIDTPVDVDPGGVQPPSNRIASASRYLSDVIGAVEREVLEYECDLLVLVRSLVRERRERLKLIAAKNANLIDLVRRELPSLDIRDEEAPLDYAPTVVDSDGGHVELALNVADRTFRDLVTVTIRWGQAVERYPKAFAPLEEELLSSLLVPSLNVAFETAQREVFQGEGKTDLFVEAARGKRGRAAFFGEAKVWDGQARVPADIEQLFKYSNARTSELMLLYYVKKHVLSVIESRAKKAIGLCHEYFVCWDDEAVDSVAIVRHPRFHQRIRVSCIFIHIPKSGRDEFDEDDVTEA